MAGLGSTLLAISCCLPLPAVLGSSALGAAGAWLPETRPYLMAASLAALAYGFWRLYSPKQCERRGIVAQGVLWMSLLATLAFLVFPQKIANLLAGPGAGSTAVSRSLPLSTFKLESFKTAFNAASAEHRLIVLLSPT